MAIFEIENYTKEKIYQELKNRSLLDSTSIYFSHSLVHENSIQLITETASANKRIFSNLLVNMSILKLKEIVEDMIKNNATYSNPVTQQTGEYYMDFCDLADKVTSHDQPYILRFGMFYTRDDYDRDIDFVFLNSTFCFFELFISIQLDIHEGQNIRIGMDENGKDFYEFKNKYKECIRFEIIKSTSVINILYKILPLF